MKIRKAGERGHANFGWLNSWHSFSFGNYYDPAHMGFGALRVINDDTVAPGAGFPEHGHTDMEIISYVLDGALQHRDSTGGGSIIRPGEIQRMSAGTGIRHSEFNASRESAVYFLQIWVLPDSKGIAPGYEQKQFSIEEKRGALRLVASSDGRDGSVTVQQDIDIHASMPVAGQPLTFEIRRGRIAWLQVARGAIIVNGAHLAAGDGAAFDSMASLIIETPDGRADDAEFLLFDMAE